MIGILIKFISKKSPIHNFFLESKTIDCEPPYDEVTEKGVAITSPNYPDDYGNSLDCQVTIRFGVNETVAITFVVFSVSYNRDRNCKNDFLTIHDGESTASPLIGSKLCGTSPSGTTIRSTGNAMTLHFHTNHYDNKTGFRLYANAGKNFDVFDYFLSKVPYILHCL